jgi:thymidylate synthase
MHVINARNVNDAYRKGMQLIDRVGVPVETRNGPAITVETAVTTQYLYPQERVLWSPKRDANPFFHLFEALWILAGRDDLATLEYFLPNFRDYSDNGVTLWGAYGARLRRYPLQGSTIVDQLNVVVQKLRANPYDRRIVATIWNVVDLTAESRDIPCNDMIKFRVVKERLNMYVFNRSNDAIWGCYGANAVHFSFIQEYVAHRAGYSIGEYEQISTDLHAYSAMWDKFWPLTDTAPDQYHYVGSKLLNTVAIHPLVTTPSWIDADLYEFFNSWDSIRRGKVVGRDIRNSFFVHVAMPMLRAFALYRDEGEPALGAVLLEEAIHRTENYDWFVAGWHWLMRRSVAKQNKQRMAEREEFIAKCENSGNG